MQPAHAYLSQDRIRALIAGEQFPESTTGSVLFADISGFTPLADALARLYGARRGADELTLRLNEVYTLLISQVEAFGGSVIGFAGDAITCWFAESGKAECEFSLRAVAAALAMQQAMQPIAQVKISANTSVQLAIKTAVASGAVQRFVVGDPAIQLIDVLAGATLDRMAAAEHLCQMNELWIDEATAQALADQITISEWRSDAQDERFARVVSLSGTAATNLTTADPTTANLTTADLTTAGLATSDCTTTVDVQDWVLVALRKRLQEQNGRFLAELRPATSLFLRFSGLDFDNDSEAGSKLDRFIRHVQRVINRHEAALIQLTTGDKGSYLYVAFGAPIAHDDDARRAVVAALELRNSVSQFPFLSSLHIGISQGAMRVGPYGSSTRQTYGVLGEEVNMAARLMTNAVDGQILVSKVVYEATANDFTFDEPRQLRLKGRSALQTVYSVIGRQSRIASHLQRLYEEPLAAREQELAQMQQSLAQVMAGNGRILRIEGSAGVGKSHLVAAFLKDVAALGISSAAAICQSTERDTAYHAVRQITRALFKIDEQMSGAAVIERIEESVRNSNPSLLLRLPLLGEIIGIEIADNPTTASLDAKLRQEALQSLAVELLQAGARRSPLVLLAEDVHWMDEASQSLLLALARVIEAAPILLLVVHRPGGRDGEMGRWGDGEKFLTELAGLTSQDFIRLEELPPSGTIQLVTQRLCGAVSPLAVALIQAQAQGNPFFTEELVDALREGERLLEVEGVWTLSEATIAALQAGNCLLRDGEEWHLRADAELSSVDLGVPTSIQGVILSRLDRLPESVKPTAKVASVIGRLFEFDLLVRAHPLQGATPQISDDVATLVERDFARIERPEPALAYIFKHNITQEVAYNTLLENQRREIHQSVALALEEAQPEAMDRLAFHFYNGDLSQPLIREKALFYLDKAATRAQRDYANETALSYLNRALQLEQRRQWLKAKVEVLDILGRREPQEETLHLLTRLVGEDDFETLLLWGKYYESVSEYEKAKEAIHQAKRKAARENDGDGQARCENELGTISWRQGEYDQAGEEHIAALSQLAISGISNPKIEIEANYGLGLLYRQRGNYGEAQNQFVKCLQLNQKINNRQFEARILNALGVVEDLQRNFQSAINYYEQALVIREAIGDRAGVGASMLNIAQSLGSMGLHDKAEGMLLNTIRLQKSIGSIWWQANTWNALGMLYLLVGNLQEARISLETGIKLSQQIGQKNTQAYLLCNLGQVLRDLGQLEQAQSVLLTALDMAFSQGDVQLEAICLNDLALTNIQQKNFSQAIQQANQSLEKFQTLGVELSITSNMALLATAYLALEENGKALHYANETIGILDRCDGEGPDYPQRDYFTCFLVYQKIGENNRAIHALSEAKRLLEKQATQISDPVMRHCFLENIPYHRSIRSITQTFGL